MRAIVSLRQRVKISFFCFFLFFLSLATTTYTHRNPSVASLLSSVILYMTGPFINVSSHISGFVHNTYEQYIHLWGVKEENETLNRRIMTLLNENAFLIEQREENKRFKELLGLEERIKFGGIIGNVVGYPPSPWVQGFILDVGKKVGISIRHPVVSGNGLVGQIIASSAINSIVMLITDGNSGVDAYILNSRARGVVEGNGKGGCVLKYIQTNEQVVPGDKVLTSGMDGIYPKGVLIGQVENVRKASDSLFYDIDIATSVNLKKLEQVMILTSYKSPQVEDLEIENEIKQ